MDLAVCYDFINFCVNKSQGVYYTPAELDLIVDRGQMLVYKKYYTKFSASQRIDDALNPFKVSYPFTSNSSGLISVPSNYMNYVSGYTSAIDSQGSTKQRPIEIVKEDELSGRLSSQVVPVTLYEPIGIWVVGWDLQLYPQSTQSGMLFYLKRPAAPVFAYTTISQRVIVYNAGSSVQLEWGEQYVEEVLITALETIGINSGEQDIQQWAAAKNQQLS